MTTTRVTSELRKLIRTLAGGTVFSVFFTRRSDNAKRLMLCRLGTRNKVKGEAGLGAAYNALDKGLLVVWDVQRDGWRSVPIESIEWIKIRGRVYTNQGIETGDQP